MISYIICLLITNIFSQNIFVTNLDDSKHLISECSKYDIIILYDTPHCSACMKKIVDCLDKYDVKNVAVIVKYNNQNSFMSRKIVQQQIKNYFKIGMQDIYFDSENGIFSFIESKYNHTPITNTPELIILDKQEVEYYKYNDLFQNGDYSNLIKIFENYSFH